MSRGVQGRWARGLISAAVTVFVLVFPHTGLTPMHVYPVICLAAVWIAQRLLGQTLGDLGFRWSDLGWKPLLIGGGAGLVFAMVNWWVIAPVLQYLTGMPPPDLSDFQFIKKNIFNFLYIQLMAWLVGGIYEELIFRGFIFTKIKSVAGREPGNFWLAAAITSLIFAVYHWQLGPYGVVNALVFAVAISALQYRFPGNLWYLVFFHALYDTFGLTMIRLGP